MFMLLSIGLWFGSQSPTVVTAQGGETPTAGASAEVPVIRLPPDGANLLQGALGVMTGNTAGGATGVVLQVYDGDRLLGETTADNQAIWGFSLPDLAPGAHTLTVRQLDANGNPLISAPVTIVVVAASTSVERPTLELADKNAVLDTASRIVVQGKGAPNSLIQLVEGTTFLGEAQTGAQGEWTFTLPLLKEGAHTIGARQLDKDAKPVSVSIPLDFTVTKAGAGSTLPGTGSEDPFGRTGLLALVGLGAALGAFGVLVLRRSRSRANG